MDAFLPLHHALVIIIFVITIFLVPAILLIYQYLEPCIIRKNLNILPFPSLYLLICLSLSNLITKTTLSWPSHKHESFLFVPIPIFVV